MKNIVRAIAVAACAGAMSVSAQDDGSFSDENNTASDSSGEAVVEIDGQVARAGGKRNPFFTLPCCRRVEGVAEVCMAGSSQWVPAEEKRHYPLGTSYRTVGKDSRLTVEFGPDCKVYIIGEASFGTIMQALDVKSRSITLMSGIVSLKLPLNFPEGSFVVTAPGFKVVNPAGESRFRYNKTGDGDLATLRCISGSFSVEGRHFKVLSMQAAKEIDIRTSQDVLFTGIYGKRGDCTVKLDQGFIKIRDVETGDERIEPKSLEWELSPQTAVRIHRSIPALGENMGVTVMTFNADGELKNRCAFTEKRFEVNSGELAPTSKGNREALAKKVAEAVDPSGAEATETVDVIPEEASQESTSTSGATEEELTF